MGNLAAIDIRMDPGETRSGVQALNPKIYGRYEEGDRRLAYLVIHPANNFMNHYLVGPLAAGGAGMLALNTRYVGNETFLLLEKAMLDLGAGMKFLRNEGYRQICLIGNSGGASLATLYQSEAEKLTIVDTPDGRPLGHSAADLPPADSLALIAAHPGRAITLTARLDASVLDERDIFSTDPELDIFAPGNQPPYSSEFLTRVRQAQLARNRKITEGCQGRLREFAAKSGTSISDQIFTVYRTMADPRFVDLSLEPNGRKGGTALESDAKAGNFAVNATAAVCTLRSWLSQWSYDLSRANGPHCLSRVQTRTMMVNMGADEIVYRSDVEAWRAAASPGTEIEEFPGVGHYPQRHDGAVGRLTKMLTRWTS